MLKISEAEYREIEVAAKANKNKRVAKRLEVLEMRHAMKSNAEIATVTGFNKLYVTTLERVSKSINPNKKRGNMQLDKKNQKGNMG